MFQHFFDFQPSYYILPSKQILLVLQRYSFWTIKQYIIVKCMA